MGALTLLVMPAEIDHDGPVPVYRQLASILRDRIESGDLPPGRALPSRERLADEFAVARGTVEKALALLREDGLVQTTPGRGVFVTGKR
jgi:GntR family transcriptional regulator